MRSTVTFPIIVLAAGQSSRMRGADKLMELVEGEPLVRRQARLARSVTSGPVIVALPSRPHPRFAALEGLDVDTLEIPDAFDGMNTSIRRAFAQVPASAPAAMLVLADLPDLTEADLHKVAQAYDDKSEMMVWRGATEDGKPGHPIIFAAALFPEIEKLSGDDGARAIVRAAGEKVQLIPLQGDRARRDLDTPEDWATWRRDNTG